MPAFSKQQLNGLIHMKIRLSHTAMEKFLECERKFQLDRLLESIRDPTASEHFAFGHAYEAGCVSYILNKDKDLAIWACYMAYFGMEGDLIAIPETQVKNEMTAMNLVIASFPHLDSLLEDWEVAIFQSRPATQLSFKVDIDETFYYVGYIDIVLRNRYTGRYAVMDFKTTGLSLLNLEPLYQNSAQLVGYSISLDFIVGKDCAEYDVLYFVGQLMKGKEWMPKITPLVFEKTLKDRLNFFITLGMDTKRLAEMLELGIFPQRGSTCLKYNKPCYHFGTCGLHSLDKLKAEEEDRTEYQFSFTLDEVIKDHMERAY